MKIIRSAIILFFLLSLLTGLAYPLLVTGIGQLFFPKKTAGSLMLVGEKTVGSKIIGQEFKEARYFWGRPSATSTSSYSALASGGSNLGPLNPLLIDAVKTRIDLLKQYPVNHSGLIPVDLVTASASGLDPHITPASALYQANRIADARGLGIDKIRQLIQAHIEPRQFGIFGEPRVNVLKLNIALDQITTMI
jgi:potassium-transporting ATPase KdpC subunit